MMATTIVHLEIPGGADTAPAQALRGGLFGWQFRELPGAPAGYFDTRITDSQGAAVSAIEPDKRGIRPYFEVEDIDAGITRVTDLHGEVYEKMPIPESGWFALCRDPHGNQFGLWQNDPTTPPPSR